MDDQLDPRDVLRNWIDNEGRSQTWVADKIGYTRPMLNYVLQKRRRMSKRMVRDVNAQLATYGLHLTWIPDQPVVEDEISQPLSL